MKAPLFLALLAGSALAGAQTYYLSVDLGTLGGTNSYVGDVNVAGQVVGYSSTANDTHVHAFLYSSGHLHDLGTLPGDTDSYAFGINNLGEIVGWSQSAGGQRHAFVYANGVMRSIGNLGVDSLAISINDSHQVTGSSVTATGDTHAFLYSGGSMSDLGDLGYSTSYGVSINALGQVAGYGNTANFRSDAFFNANGTMQDLGRPIGFDYARVWGLNDSGQIVGACSNGGEQGIAFLFSNGSFRMLGTLGGVWSHGYGINNAGDIVGASTTGTNGGYMHGFIYRNGAMTDLNSLIKPSRPFIKLWSAQAISDNGYIAGVQGLSSGLGPSHATLLVPLPVIGVTPHF